MRGFAVLHGLCKQAGSFLFVFLSGQGHLHIMSISTQKFTDWGWAKMAFSHRTKNVKSSTFIFEEAQPALCTFFFLIHIFLKCQGKFKQCLSKQKYIDGMCWFHFFKFYSGHSCGLHLALGLPLTWLLTPWALYFSLIIWFCCPH